MNTKLITTALIACSLLASCASSSKSGASADTPIPAGKGRIVCYRPSGMYGYAMRAAILLDGQKIGSSSPGAKCQADVTPGLHTITVPNVMYSGENRLDVTVTAGTTTYVRSSIGGGAMAGRITLDIIPPAAGAPESAKMRMQ